MFSLCGKNFVLAKVGLVRAGCPQELIDTPPNRSMESAIVIVANKAKLGFIQATGYYPKGVIVAGAMRRRKLQEAGIVCSWAFVEAGLDIKLDETIQCSELMGKLDELLTEKFHGQQRRPITGQTWPQITEIYPLENYFVCSVRGETFKQGYALDPVARRCALINACNQVMPRVQTGVRYAYAPPQANGQTSTTGAKNSELVTQIIRNWTDVDAAVNAYLDDCRLSGAVLKPPMKPSFAPISLSPAGKIMAMLTAKGINVYDFARWSASVQHKKLRAKLSTKKTPQGGPTPGLGSATRAGL